MLCLRFVGAIVVDTVCFSEEADRTTQKDRDVAARLEKILPGIDRRILFDKVQAAKADISGVVYFIDPSAGANP